MMAASKQKSSRLCCPGQVLIHKSQEGGKSMQVWRHDNVQAQQLVGSSLINLIGALANFFDIHKQVPKQQNRNHYNVHRTLLMRTRSATGFSCYDRKNSLITPQIQQSLKKIKANQTIQDIRYQNKRPNSQYWFKVYILFYFSILVSSLLINQVQAIDTISEQNSDSSNPQPSASTTTSTTASCFGGIQTFEKISMSTFENPSTQSSSTGAFGSGILIQQDDQALTSECVNLCRSQPNCLSFVIDYNKFECKSYATTQQELQQEFDSKYQAARSITNSTSNTTEFNGYLTSSSNLNFQHLLPSASSNYFEKICLDGIANRNQFNDACGQGRLWIVERVVDSFLDGYVEKEVTNVNNKDECSKLCIFETQFVCRSADYDQQSRLCRLSKEDRRTQPQAMRYASGSNRQYLENQCATPGPSSCIYEVQKNVAIISMDALKFSQNVQDCQMKCNQESTFNCRSYSFHQQRCFLSGDDSTSLSSSLIKLPVKQGWQFGEKKCLVELCTKGIFTYEKITGYTLRSALSTPIDLMMHSGSSLSVSVIGNNIEDLEKMQQESSQTKLSQLLPVFHPKAFRNTSYLTNSMMTTTIDHEISEPLNESASSTRQHRSTNNLAITNHCRHSCDLGNLNCPAFTIDYRNNRCQRLDRNSQGRHHELVAKDGFAYYEKICLRVPEIMSMCQDKYWIFERVIGYELAPRMYEKSLKFVQSRRDCEEYCLEEKQFQCRSALYNDEISDCKLSRYDRRFAIQEGAYNRNFNPRISYLENQCIRDRSQEKSLSCFYEQAREEPAYPTYTEYIEMVPPISTLEIESDRHVVANSSATNRYGSSYCEQLCNDNTRFECHSFGYYPSTAQCFLSSDDSISAGETSSTFSTGFTYFEKKCRLTPMMGQPNSTSLADPPRMGESGITQTEPPQTTIQNQNPYFQPTRRPNIETTYSTTMITETDTSSSIDKTSRPIVVKPNIHSTPRPFDTDANNYKCGYGNTFVYQRVPGFEPIGGYLTLLVKDNEQPGIVNECAELCKSAHECRAFVVDYGSNQCFAMLENSSVGLLSLRQTIGKDYFEGFCIADHLLNSNISCRNRTWVIDKIVDQAAVGVQAHRVIPNSDRTSCRQACLDERFFWCKSAMFESVTKDCRLFSIDRESNPALRLVFTKGVDFFENLCRISSNSCPYDAIERDLTIVTVTKSYQAKSTFDCEHACDTELGFNCRSYTYLDKYPSLPNFCLLSSDSRSTSQKGSVIHHSRTLYAERNCFFRKPRIPSGHVSMMDPNNAPGYQPHISSPGITHHLSNDLKPHNRHMDIDRDYGGAPQTDMRNPLVFPNNNETPISQACKNHHYTFERTFGYDFRLGQKERAPIAPTIGIAIACQQECLRQGERCQSFVVEYSLPYQSCFLIDTQVGANKKLLVKSPNTAYFEKICLPRPGLTVEPQIDGHQSLNIQSQDIQHMDMAPGYSQEPWSHQLTQPQSYLQQQQLLQTYPSRSCSKLWSFERFINHNFTAPSDKIFEDILTKSQCETLCLNEANFSCRAITYDYNKQLCRLFRNTRRTVMSQFLDLESNNTQAAVQTLTEEAELVTPTYGSDTAGNIPTRSNSGRQLNSVELSSTSINIDYMENICVPEPSSCQYRQIYDLFSAYIERINHAISLSDCQRQCDLERLFSCKSINYDPSTRKCMLINEDLISLNRGQQALLPKKNTVYSEKGNCEMISVQCNSQEMLVSLNFDTPFRGRVMAKGNPEQCFLIGDGQTSVQFPIVFGPKCNSRQEGHNTFVNEVVIQQHPVIMTDSDKVVRVMCAFEAPEQTITLKNPSSRDNKTGIDVGSSESTRTRNDKQQFSSVISNKAAPPSVMLRILDQSGRDASMINLGDDLTLKIQMPMDGQNSALGIFARNLAARSSSGESLILIDNDGCPVDHQVFPSLEIDPKDGRSLYSTFKAFRFPSSGLVNFEVQIRFCPERCQPVECHRSNRMKSYGRRKREIGANLQHRTPILQSVNPIEVPGTKMEPGKAFQFVRELLFIQQPNSNTKSDSSVQKVDDIVPSVSEAPSISPITDATDGFDNSNLKPGFVVRTERPEDISQDADSQINSENRGQNDNPILESPFQKNILLHVDERVVPVSNKLNTWIVDRPHNQAPYGQFPVSNIDLTQKRHTLTTSMPEVIVDQSTQTLNYAPESIQNSTNGPEQVYPEITPSPDGFQKFDSSNEAQKDIPVGPINQPVREATQSKDMPLRFSILVGEGLKTPQPDWFSGSSNSVVMNSSKLDLDHIVIPGQDNHPNQNVHNTIAITDDANTTQNYSENSYGIQDNSNDSTNPTTTLSSKRASYEQTFDAQSSNSIVAEVTADSQIAENRDHLSPRQKLRNQPSEAAASRDCQVDSGNRRLWTIIWTGAFVIALNICLVIVSLTLYFRKVHLRKNHIIVNSSSDCATNSSDRSRRWPSVLLKSKNDLGTSIDAHEHFFCKLNSKQDSNLRGNHEFNWPNLSSSSSHSTITSIASPIPVSSVRIHQTRTPYKYPFDTQSSVRNNFNPGFKSILDENFGNNIEHGAYTNNMDGGDTFHSPR